MAILDHQSQPTPALSTDLLQYEPQQAPDTIDLGELIGIFFRRWWIMLAGLLVVFSVGMIYTLMQRPVYESTSSILVVSSKSSRSDELPLLSDLQALTQGRSVDTQVEILSSPDQLDDAFTRMNSMREKANSAPYPHSMFQGRAQIAAKKNTDIISIKTSAYSAESAADYANAIAQTYLEHNLEDNRLATRQAREYVEKRLKIVQREFALSNDELARFKQQTGLIVPDAQLDRYVEALTTMQMDLDKAKAQTNADQQSLNSLQSQLKGMQLTVTSNATLTVNPRVSASVARLDSLNSDRAKLLQEFTLTSPEVKALDAQIQDEKRTLDQLTHMVVASETHARYPVRDDLLKNYSTSLANLAADTARVRALSSEIQGRKSDIAKLPKAEQRLTLLMLGLDLQKNLVNMLTQKYHTLLISETATLPDVRIVSQARPAEAPVSPKIKRNIILFLLLGLMCGIGLAMLLERLDDRIHDQETAEKLTGLVTMGTIHEIEEGEPKIISGDNKKSQLLERFRVLRNNISFSSIDRNIRLMAVTSTGPSEGKSTCCTNLGIVMAMDGKRVLVVDCDLHRPSMHTLLKSPRDIGFTNVVMGATPLKEAIVSTEHEGLDFLPAGILPPNPSEILNAQPTRQLFKELAEMYDLVILDCPPSVKLSDVQVISTIVDGILLLVAADQTLKRGLLFAHRALTQVSAPLIGLVVNRLDLRHHGYGYYYGYGYYGYYYYYGQYEYGVDTAPNTRRKRRKQRKPHHTLKNDD